MASDKRRRVNCLISRLFLLCVFILTRRHLLIVEIYLLLTCFSLQTGFNLIFFLCGFRLVLQVTRINHLSRARFLPAQQCTYHCSTSSLDKATLLLHMLVNPVLQHHLLLVCVRSISSTQPVLLAIHPQAYRLKQL